MLIKTRGIVLRQTKYGESSIITDIFTEEKGLQTYIISGVRTKGAKVKSSLFQPMSILDLVVYYKEGSQSVQRIKEVRSALPYQSIPFQIAKGGVGLFLTEVLRNAVHEPEPNTDLFVFVYEVFQYLDETHQSVSNVPLWFMLHLSQWLGFQPGGRKSERTPVFDLRSGSFEARSPKSHDHWLGEKLAGHWQFLLDQPLAEAHNLHLTAHERRQLLRCTIDYYALHLENFQTPQSHLILEQILHG